MRLLVTRPERDGPATTARLQSMGHEAVLEPLLGIRYLDFPNPDSTGIQALIATSANGIRALADKNIVKMFEHLPILTIGEASAEAARQSGFKHVLICGGTLSALAQDVPKHLQPENGKILYLAGRARSGDLVGLLAEHGFSTEMAVLYEAVPVARFSETTRSLIRENKLDGVLHFSARTAGIYLDLIEAEGLREQAASHIHFCLSQQVAKRLEAGRCPPDQLRIAEQPTLDSLLACVAAS
ncbi:MAG: uroporphyrinogen-III synthase [Fimbriimonadaceae bacterium]|nr:uroporphyrinogen-III synthase [Alphaproteobacteria bacterium]